MDMERSEIICDYMASIPPAAALQKHGALLLDALPPRSHASTPRHLAAASFGMDKLFEPSSRQAFVVNLEVQTPTILKGISKCNIWKLCEQQMHIYTHNQSTIVRTADTLAPMKEESRAVAGSPQYPVLPVVDHGGGEQRGRSGEHAAGGLPEDGGVGDPEERDVNVHAEDSGDDDGAGDHERGGGQHHPHLQQLVLLVVQHDVDVVLRVLHVHPQLNSVRQQKSTPLINPPSTRNLNKHFSVLHRRRSMQAAGPYSGELVQGAVDPYEVGFQQVLQFVDLGREGYGSSVAIVLVIFPAHRAKRKSGP